MSAAEQLNAATKRIAELESRLSAVIALCDSRTPPGQCLVADDGVDCESHCDCGWGTLWHDSVRAAATGSP